VVRCFVCGLPVRPEDATLEHVQPAGLGGTDREANLAISHGACNQEKGIKLVSGKT
jgi:5-methylcytosine-specific restriction endonuclease McrA